MISDWPNYSHLNTMEGTKCQHPNIDNKSNYLTQCYFRLEAERESSYSGCVDQSCSAVPNLTSRVQDIIWSRLFRPCETLPPFAGPPASDKRLFSFYQVRY